MTVWRVTFFTSLFKEISSCLLVQQWLLNGMGLAVPYKILSKRGRLHYGLTYLFDKAVRPLMEQELNRLEERIVGGETPVVIVFSGHSLGAVMAQLSAWYLAKRAKTLVDRNLLQIRTVAFGCPSVSFAHTGNL